MGKKIYTLIIIAVAIVIIAIPVYFIYSIFFVKSTSKNFETTGIITEMEFEEGKWETKEVTKKVKQEDGTTKKVKEKKKIYDYEEWDLEIEYTDSEGRERIYKEEPIEKSGLYKSLEKNNLKVGDKVKLLIEERFRGDSLVGTDIIGVIEDKK
ncbi:hypothetical protein [Romboutsia hominis]|uniref:hypothetical protein n=1 Tax=Romboutsia hominis TaxID=1507512 RepID=UPI001F05EE57|nr:hypothetical protein [Romboutsia hominis]MCH1959932.1 hypothetical protein [Romboutsia hominis]MCH1969645.1 hypothetical protein [Romboutsia hominis]